MRFELLKYSLLSLLLFAFLSGCDNDDAGSDRYVITDEDELSFGILAAADSTRIITTGRWSVEADGLELQPDGSGKGEWFSVNAMSGSGNFMLTVSADFNNMDAAREVTIRIRSENTAELVISQAESDDLETYFDPLFYEYFLSSDFPIGIDKPDANGDGKLSGSEAFAVETIDLNYGPAANLGNYESLKGLEYFPNLKSLTCSGNKFTEISFSNNTLLETLDCSDNALLEEISFKNNPLLAELDASQTIIDSLYLNTTPAIRSVNGEAMTGLRGVIVSENTELLTLTISEAKMTLLDVAGAPNIEELSVTDNAQLKILTAPGLNNLSTFTWSGNSAAIKVELTGTKLPGISLPGSPNMEELILTGNSRATAIDISDCGDKLRKLNCEEGNSSLATIYVWAGFDKNKVDGAGYLWIYPQDVQFEQP